LVNQENPMDFDTTRRPPRAVALVLPGILAVALSACGVPRAHEVYRLTSLEASMDSVALELGDAGLSDAQRDLRRLALAARELRPARVRQESIGAAAPVTPPLLAASVSSTLHGCGPNPLAEFTVGSATRTPPERHWLAQLQLPHADTAGTH
jgi:hypothetical protein